MIKINGICAAKVARAAFLGYHVVTLNNVTTVTDSDGNQSPEIDTAVQAIIDNFDPLPEAKAEAIDRINTAAGMVRAKYATDIPFQTDAYKRKLDDALAFKAAGYPEGNLADYLYMNARATRQGVTGKVAANDIIEVSTNWDHLMFSIENARDAANEQIDALTDWQQCSVVADALVAQLEAI